MRYFCVNFVVADVDFGLTLTLLYSFLLPWAHLPSPLACAPTPSYPCYDVFLLPLCVAMETEGYSLSERRQWMRRNDQSKISDVIPPPFLPFTYLPRQKCLSSSAVCTVRLGRLLPHFCVRLVRSHARTFITRETYAHTHTHTA